MQIQGLGGTAAAAVAAAITTTQTTNAEPDTSLNSGAGVVAEVGPTDVPAAANQPGLDAARRQAEAQPTFQPSPLLRDVANNIQSARERANAPVVSTVRPPQGHEPFSAEERRLTAEHNLRGEHRARADVGEVPQALKETYAIIDEKAVDRAVDRAFTNYDRSIRHKIEPLDVQVFYDVSAQSPDHAKSFAIKLVENIIETTEPDAVIPGLSREDSRELRRLQNEHLKSGPELVGKPKADIDRDNAAYEKACFEYVSEKIYGVHKTLVDNALKGTDLKASAEGIFDTVGDATLTNDQKRERIERFVSGVGPDRLKYLAGEYSAVPLRREAQRLHAAMTDQNLEVVREIMGNRSGVECAELISYANQYARANSKPTFEHLSLEIGNKGKKEELEIRTLERGFNARSLAIKAYDGASNTDTVRAAFGYRKDADGKESSIYNSSQIEAIKARLGEYAKEKGQDPAAAIQKAVDAAKPAIDNPAPELRHPNLYLVLKNSGSRVDGDLAVLSTAMAQGYEGALGADMLHNALHRGDGATALRILQRGPSDQTKGYLTPADRFPMLAAYQDMFDNPDIGMRQNLVTVVDKRLTGSERIQALQILGQNFCAAEQAEIVGADVRKVSSLVDRSLSLSENIERIRQTDEEYRKTHAGKSLASAVEESSLTTAEKNELLAILSLERSTALRAELSKQKPEMKAISGFLADPRAEFFYNATFYGTNAGPQRSLQGELEALGENGKLARKEVVAQILMLRKMPPDLVLNLEKEMDPANPKIGTKESVLRAVPPEKMGILEHLYAYQGRGRVLTPGQTFKDLRQEIVDLQKDHPKEFSEDQCLRVGMTLSGLDPWETADQIDKNRQLTPWILDGFNESMTRVVVEAYKEQKGDDPLRVILNDRSLRDGFKNDTEYQNWIDTVTDRLYDPESLDNRKSANNPKGLEPTVRVDVVKLFDALKELRADTAPTPERQKELLDSLTATLETAKKNGTLLRVVAVYEAYFGAKDKSALMTAVDELAQKKIVDDKKQAALKDLIQNQPH